MKDNNTREDNIYFARLSEQGERYEDMIKYMQRVAKVSCTKNSLLSRLTRNSPTTKETSFQLHTRTRLRPDVTHGEPSRPFKTKKS